MNMISLLYSERKGFHATGTILTSVNKNTYGNIDLSQQALSDVGPDLDDEQIEIIKNVSRGEIKSVNLEIEEPEAEEVSPVRHPRRWDFKKAFEIKEMSPVKKDLSDVEEVKSLQRAMSETTPKNLKMLSTSTNDMKKLETLPMNRDGLKEKIDNSSHVKSCLNRKDVVIKSILRSMRKYYSDLVQDNSEYKRKIRNIKLKHKTLVSCALELAKTLALSSAPNNVAFYLTAIAFPTDLRKILSKAGEENPSSKHRYNIGMQAIDKIENAMTRYSKKVMNEFMDIPEVCLLLLNYLSKVENREYSEHIQMLKEMATESLVLVESKNDASSEMEGQIINNLVQS